MSPFPQYVEDILKTKFNSCQMQTISENWGHYSNGFRFSSATKGQIIKEGKMVLECYAFELGEEVL